MSERTPPLGIGGLPEVDALIESMGDRPFLVPWVTPNDGKHRKTQVFHYLRDMCDVGLLAHTNQGYVRCDCGGGLRG